MIVGDAHIPVRQFSIPDAFLPLLSSGKIEQVISVGNATDARTAKFLKSIAPSQQVIAVCGDLDVPSSTLPTVQTLEVGKRRIGVVSSFLIQPAGDLDALTMVARELDVDVLLWGGTHEQDANACAGYSFINPGTLTGADNPRLWANADSEIVPGFCLLEIDNHTATTYMYHLRDENIVVSKASLPLKALPE